MLDYEYDYENENDRPATPSPSHQPPPFMRPGLRKTLWILGIALAVGLIFTGAVYLAMANAVAKPTGQAAYVGRDTCKDCHTVAFEAWTGSHHDLAMDHATDATVLGDFNDATFEHMGVTSRFFKRDGKFFVHTEGPGGVMQDFEIAYVFGVTPLQQYLIPFPGGRLQSLTIAWDTIRKRWYHLYPDEHIPHDDQLHWTRRLQNWNYMCAQCHSTNLQKNYDHLTDTYNTTWSEIDVSCEACHGPGSHHLEWASASKLRQMFMGDNYALTTDLNSSNDAQINACFQCHARRQVISTDYDHGEPYADHFMPELLHTGLYYPDGQILDEVYEFNSFTQSKMYHQEIRCSDCHDPHRLIVYTNTNILCIRCHDIQKYDSPSHHFHTPGTTGANCVDCHMTTRTYMGVDVRRDHSLRVPRPDLSVKLGVPNACNQCHTDKSAEWAAEYVVKWYGPKRQYDDTWPIDPHWGEVIAPARESDPAALVPLIAMIQNPKIPAIVRATGVYLLRSYGDVKATEAMIAATRDEHLIVRAAAAGGLERLAFEQRVEVLAPLLRDEYRGVRIEAARVLAAVPMEQLEPEQAKAMDAALAEYVTSQMANSDQPGSWVNLGVMHADRG